MDRHFEALEFDKVLGMLADCCVSDGAKAAARELEPFCGFEKVSRALTQTEDAYKLICAYTAPSFSGAASIDEALVRAKAGGLLNMSELLRTARVLSTVRGLQAWRAHSEGVQTSLDGMFAALYSNKGLEENITSRIKNEEELYDTASNELYSIRRKMSAASNKIRDKLNSLIRSGATQKYLQDAVVTQRNGRYVVPVKQEYKGEISGLIHDTSSSGATVFIEPMAVVEANNEIKLLTAKEKDEIERILYELTAAVADAADSIADSVRVMLALDLIFAKAKLGVDMKASVPKLNDTGNIRLRQARHPLLSADTVVPVDITLGGEYKTLVITGPNTGGKTVTLKAVGLITLMAMCGLLIPCADNSELSVFDKIFADIGDEQSIEQSLSTFSSHIKNIIEIIGAADNSSLVLLDELCSGTDPVEGAALATAILETLRSFGAVIAATTHYAELKAYALDTPGVENACCEFDVKTLAPTYRLLIGVPGRSNAFAISQRLGMDESVVRRAKSFINPDNTRFERVVASLESSRRMLDDQRESVKAEMERAQRAVKESEERARRLTDEYNEKIEQAKEQARVISENARIEANRMLDELERIKKLDRVDITAARQTAKAGFKKLDELGGEGKRYEEDYSLPRPLVEGDTVLLAETGQKATVLSLPDGKNTIRVQAGIMKIKVDLKAVRLVEESGINIPESVYKRTASADGAAKSLPSELDVRGMTVDEAAERLDIFIDSLILGGMRQFTLIHGKGTGALRTGLRAYLRRHKAVQSARPGLYGEGEDGVTIVELK